MSVFNVEEPLIISATLVPGFVNTEIFKSVVERNPEECGMEKELMDHFKNSDKIVEPCVPAEVIAKFMISPPLEAKGKFLGREELEQMQSKQ